jgi:L-ascorbate metabolism protein UlaG (beta-lactamase superfamily)
MRTVIVAFILVFFAGGSMLTSCSTFGTRLKGEALEKIKTSKNYDNVQNIFVNRKPNIIKEMKKESMNFGVIKEWLFSEKGRVPNYKLPEVKPDLEEFLKESNEIKVIWFGHSTFLLRLDGKTILVDPVFSEYASPIKFMVKRFQNPVLSLEELPEIDYIVISHDHYDHLDMNSIKFFKDKDTTFITPLGVGEHIKGWGIDSSRINERDWWQSYKVGSLEFIATPAQHFSGRDGLHDNETLWASWVIKSEFKSIYFSGDSGYDTHFKDIGNKYGPFDLAFIESGQYNESWKAVHMLPSEAVKAYVDLKANRYFPVHWGMFELSMHTWNDPVIQLDHLSAGNEVNLVIPKLGQMIEVDDSFKLDKWWLSN